MPRASRFELMKLNWRVNVPENSESKFCTVKSHLTVFSVHSSESQVGVTSKSLSAYEIWTREHPGDTCDSEDSDELDEPPPPPPPVFDSVFPFVISIGDWEFSLSCS